LANWITAYRDDSEEASEFVSISIYLATKMVELGEQLLNYSAENHGQDPAHILRDCFTHVKTVGTLDHIRSIWFSSMTQLENPNSN
jgi:hypothetical protein